MIITEFVLMAMQEVPVKTIKRAAMFTMLGFDIVVTVLAAYLKGGAGMAIRAFHGLAFVYLQGSLQAHRDIHKGYAIGPGLQLSWVRQRSRSQTLIQLDHEHLMEGAALDTYEFTARQGFAVSDNSQWMASFVRRKITGKDFSAWTPEWVSEWRLEFRQYF